MLCSSPRGDASSASDMLPDDLPGQSNMAGAVASGSGSDAASDEPFSLFSSATKAPVGRGTSQPVQIPGVHSNVVPALIRPQVMLTLTHIASLCKTWSVAFYHHQFD